MINTLTIYDILQEANFKEPQARAITKAIEEGERQTIEEVKKQTTSKEEVSTIKGDLQHVATREDMVKLEGALREDMVKLEGALREDMAKLEGRLREDMAKLREDMAKLEGTLIKWTVMIVASQAVIVLGGVAFMLFYAKA